MKTDKYSEKVLCVPRNLLITEPFEGFRDPCSFGHTPSERYELLNELVEKEGVFVARSECETDASLQQIIPYPIISDGHRFFYVERNSAGTEDRLHNKVSLGHGGHINEHDRVVVIDDQNCFCNIPRGMIYSGMIRELHEEVNISGNYNVSFKGEINFEDNEVSSVHYGLVFMVRPWKHLDATSNEPDKISRSGWKTIGKVNELNLETWSSAAIEGMY